MIFEKRQSGLPSVGELPWGTHFCQLYESERDLLEVIVPFLRTGLANNELCQWTVANLGDLDEARRALAEAVPDLDERERTGQLELLAREAGTKAGPAADLAIEAKVFDAVARGFDGLRLASHAVRLGRENPELVCPGAESIGTLNVVAAFCYPRDQLDAVGLMDAVGRHQFALVRGASGWEVLESSEALRVRQELARSEQKLRSLFANMTEGFAYHRIVLDASGRPCDYVFMEVNSAFARLTGVDPEAVLGRPVTKVFPGIENDEADWIGRYGEVALTGRPIQFESYSKPLDRWYAVSAFCPHRGFFAVTFADITSRKQAEAERRAIKERLAVTLRSIGDAVLSTDAGGRITFLNPVASELTGYGAAEAIGLPANEVFRIIDESTREPRPDIVRHVLREKRVVELANHTALVSKDGREVPIEDSAAPILTDDGELTGVVLVFHDVTAKRRASAALRHAHDELEDRVRERTEQLRAANEQLEARAEQLRALAGELTLAEQRERRRIAKLLHDNLQQLLVAAKFRIIALERAGGNAARPEAAAIEALLDEAIRSSRSLTAEISPPILYDQGLVPALRWLVGWMSEKHGLSVELTTDRADLTLPEDLSVLLFESVREILFNVVKHAGVGSAAVAVGARGRWLRITVSDTGIGFDPTAPHPGGTTGGGFGLMSIRERLGLLGGSLQIDSAQGAGTRIVVTAQTPTRLTQDRLPAVPDGGPPLQGAARTHGGRIRVVLADDHPVMRDGLVELLAQEPDIEVVGQAADGRAAVELAVALFPDVVLMDVSMAGVGGIDATRMIREQAPHVKVIGLSMLDDGEVAQAMLAAGASMYLTKSGPTGEIVGAVRACAEAVATAPPPGRGRPVLIDD